MPDAAEFMQYSLVAEDHEEVEHTAPPTRKVGVMSVFAKLRPCTVTGDPPLVAPLETAMNDADGASKLKPSYCVPLNDATCRAKLWVPVPEMPAAPHCTVVAELHDEVLHIVEPTAIDGVRSVEMKLRPETVTEAPLEDGLLMGAPAVTTGASNVKADSAVATTLCTVNPTTLPVP